MIVIYVKLVIALTLMWCINMSTKSASIMALESSNYIIRRGLYVRIPVLQCTNLERSITEKRTVELLAITKGKWVVDNAEVLFAQESSIFSTESYMIADNASRSDIL